MEDRNIICLKSELDLFHGATTQLGIDASSFQELYPLSSLGSGSTSLEFYANSTGDAYLDVSHTILHLKISVTKKNGDKLLDTDSVAPINYILNTLFSECSIYLNDKQISSQVNYSYRAYLESLLFFNRASQESLLSTGLFIKDAPVITIA